MPGIKGLSRKQHPVCVQHDQSDLKTPICLSNRSKEVNIELFFAEFSDKINETETKL